MQMNASIGHRKGLFSSEAAVVVRRFRGMRGTLKRWMRDLLVMLVMLNLCKPSRSELVYKGLPTQDSSS